MLLGGCGRSVESTPPEAVFLIVVDTLRPDRLSCYGYQGHSTPNIDQMARFGTRFTQAQSVASWTVPSMGSILTSLYPTQLGLVEQPAPPGKRFEWQERRQQLNDMLSLDERTLAEVFQDAGYRTAGFINQPGLTANEGFLQGFVDWYYPVSVDQIVRYEPGSELEHKWWSPFLNKAYEIDTALINIFKEWLPVHADEKHFVWIHLLTPHAPYNPPRTVLPPDPSTLSPDDLSSLYDGEVRAIDGLVGEILAAIEQHVGFERSLVVFTSDHGEALGEHDMFEHGHSLHREVIHVPLIVMSPAVPEGKTVSQYVRTIDILPTILDIVQENDSLLAVAEGTSLLPLISGDESILAVFSEAMLYGGTERSLIAGIHKLMYDEQEDRYALYDVAEDPGETRDLSSQQAHRTEKLNAALVDFYDALAADRLARMGGAPRPREVDERMLKALRALGYVGD